MINFVRKVVGGPKRRVVEDEYDLDMTYITDRVIAMAFPASGIEKTYRNSIDQVAHYLNKKHGDNYMIVNVSNRKYDYKKFGGRVKQYAWNDHQAPTVSTLLAITKDMRSFLAINKDSVVAVHCNHGKGRTGTAIIAFIIYTGFYETASQALTFYNKRRFITNDYGVDQPCQTRVLQFIEALKFCKNFTERLTAFKLVSISQTGLEQDNFYLQISSTRSGKVRMTKVSLKQSAKIEAQPLIGDIFIEIYDKRWKGDTEMCRVNYHTEFISMDPESKAYFLQLKGLEIKVKGEYKKNFKVTLKFEQYCPCHKVSSDRQATQTCECAADRQIEDNEWQRVKEIVKESRTITKKEACTLLFVPWDVEEQKSEKSQKSQISQK